MDELVQRLSEGLHPVEVSLRPQRTIEAFRDCLARGFVLVKFTGTRGGTELGFRLDSERSDTREAASESATGTVRLAGELTLNYERVRCIADVKLPSLEGEGRLEVLS